MQGHDQIGPQRYRESFGRYYDDFVVGDVYEHRPGRTITESDNTWFTLITMNTHPLLIERAMIRRDERGRRHVGPPIRFRHEPAQPVLREPGLGEHTSSILKRTSE